MMFARGFAVWLGLGLSLSACHSGQSSESGSLCPTCKPLVGGESSDFGGGYGCADEEQPLSQTMSDELHVAEVVAAASAPLTTTLRWADSTRGDTTLTSTTTLGSAIFRARAAAATAPCRDRVLIPATVQVVTGDGGFSATLHGGVELGRGDLAWRLQAYADLASIEGNLALPVDEARDHRGRLELTLLGFPEGRRGRFNARLRYLSPDMIADPLGETTETLGPEPLDLGRFPADDCAAGFPIEPNLAHPWLGAVSPRTLHSRLRAALPANSAARWLDGSSTQMAVVPDELLDQRVCVSATFADPFVTFASAVHLQSADGRVDSWLASNATRLLGTSGIPQSWVASKTSAPLPSSESVEGIQLSTESAAGHDSLRAFFELSYEWKNDALVGGGIAEVSDSVANTKVDCAAWPLDGEHQQQCRIAP